MHIYLKLCILFVIGTTSGLPTLWGTFVFDDGEAIIKNALVTRLSSQEEDVSVGKIFSHDFWGVKISHPQSHKSYRPLTTLTYRFDYWIWGQNPFPFHLQNLVLHGLNCCLVYLFFEKCLSYRRKRLSMTLKRLSFWASIVFAVHPVHVEPLGGLVGRADLLSSLVFLCGFIFIPEGQWLNPILTAVFSIVGSLFKENAILLSIFVVALDFVVKHEFRVTKRKLIQYFISVLFTTAFVIWRLWFQGGSPIFQSYDNPPAFARSNFTKISSTIYIWSLNAFTLLNPIWLCYDFSGDCVRLIENVVDFRLIFNIVFGVTCIGLLFRALNNFVIMIACVITAVTFLPSSNLIFVVGFVLAERNLYLPSIGSSLLVAYGLLDRGSVKYFSYVVMIFYARSVQRSFQWVDQPSLFKSALQVCPNNAKIHYNLGTMYAEAGDIASAELAYKSAISLRSDYYQAMNNLGNLLRNKNLPEAEYWLKEAVRLKPDFAAAWMNLGIVVSKKNHSEALICYKTALRYRKIYPDCEYNLGNLYLDMGEKESALSSWAKASSMRNQHAQSWINSVILLEQEGKLESAKNLGLKAIEFLKDSNTLHFIVGNILGKLSEYELAKSHFETAIDLCQKSGRNPPAKYYANLGVLFHRWGHKDLAKEAYLSALNIDPASESAKNNLKLLK